MATIPCGCAAVPVSGNRSWLQRRRRPGGQVVAIRVTERGGRVVVTREKGKNGKLMEALKARGIGCIELPLIEHRQGPDQARLGQVLREEQFDWIVVTSPEAALVLWESWKGWTRSGHEGRIAVVGAGTGQVLQGLVPVEFTPSIANAKCLALELPEVRHGNGRVLYPASCKAGGDLEAGLSSRGFQVTRLNTYSTETVSGLDDEALSLAASAPVATFASPTAVKAWMELVAGTREWNGSAACIGSTSAVAARKAGLHKVFYPPQPGLDGWVSSIVEALHTEMDTNVIPQDFV